MEINGAAAVVSGGASGLGEASARALTEAGAIVTILDLNEERGEALRRLCELLNEENMVDGFVSRRGASADKNRLGDEAKALWKSQIALAEVKPSVLNVTAPGEQMQADFTTIRQSRRDFGRGYFLTEDLMEEFTDAYLVRDEDRTDPRISPIRGDLHDLPPAHVVTAAFDPLRDEGEAYAEALREAGVGVSLVREPGLIHGFATMVGFGTAAPAAVRRFAAELQRGLV